jgi:hypothetical protein
MNRVFGSALSLFVCAGLTGCGDGQAHVSGTVTFDGQPVPTGSIVFVKSDGGAREGGVIKDGKFEAKVSPGRYKIEVRASKVTGKRTQKGFDGKDEEIEQSVEMIPDRYNTKTELVEELKAGSNTVTLDLTSKK